MAYAHSIDHKGDKFASSSRRYVFLGYPYGNLGWKLFDWERKIVFVSWDVMFQESTHLFASTEMICYSHEHLLTFPTRENLDSDSEEDVAHVEVGT